MFNSFFLFILQMTADQLRSLANQHPCVTTISNCTHTTKAALLTSLCEHVCSSLCLIFLANVLASELFVDAIHLDRDAVSSSITSLNLLQGQEIPSRFKSSDIRFAPQIPSLPTLPTSATQSWPLCTPFNI